MAISKKMTFTLDSETADRIDRTAAHLAMPKSAVVREAVSEYAARADRLSETERVRLLAVFDELIPRIPKRTARSVEREAALIRAERKDGGRRSAPRNSK